MENLSHSLIGAALAEVALPRPATAAQRTLFFVAGVLAANLPDADLLYGSITPPPLGYLLHHRGYTHTLVGCALLALGIWIITLLIPVVRRTVSESPRRFWTLIALALASHLLADSWNSYGVHPFWPFDNRWFYGDAIFILEPWFWLVLGAAAAANTRSRIGRWLLTAVVVALPLAAVGLHMIPTGGFTALAVCGVLLAIVVPRLTPLRRSGAALAFTGLYVTAMFAVSHAAYADVIASLRSQQTGEIVDVVLSPGAGQQLCWSALAVEKIESEDEYVLRRGEVSPFGAVGCGRASAVVWRTTFRESLSALRARSRDDCWVRAWLQFGRAPALRPNVIADVRYDEPGGQGFTAMQLRPLSEARSCPPHLTNWTMPRADLLSP